MCLTINKWFSRQVFKSATCYVRTQSTDSQKILITGSLGQLGTGIASKLRSQYGRDNVVMSDVIRAPKHITENGPFIYADILDYKNLQSIVVNHEVDTIIHLSALLSAIGEQNVSEALKINIYGFHNIVEICRRYNVKLFCPSTIGAFGSDSPRDPTPDVTVQRPRTIYGVSKVHMELMGEYYHTRYGLDFRSARLPGVISAFTLPGGGTTDYANHIFHEALKTGKFECNLSQDTRLPMMYLPDVINGVSQLLDAPAQNLKIRTYNISAMSFTPDELTEAIKVYIPDFEITYNVNSTFQNIVILHEEISKMLVILLKYSLKELADNWPKRLDDSNARGDWQWKPEFDLDGMCREMLTLLAPQYGKHVSISQS